MFSDQALIQKACFDQVPHCARFASPCAVDHVHWRSDGVGCSVICTIRLTDGLNADQIVDSYILASGMPWFPRGLKI